MAEIYRVYEFDTNRPRLFAEHRWALDFATAEKRAAESRAGIYAEMGDDVEMAEAEDILGGGLVEPELWVEEEYAADDVAEKVRDKGPAGASWSEV